MSEMTAKELVKILQIEADWRMNCAKERWKLTFLKSGQDIEENIKAQFLQEIIGFCEEKIKKFERIKRASSTAQKPSRINKLIQAVLASQYA